MSWGRGGFVKRCGGFVEVVVESFVLYKNRGKEAFRFHFMIYFFKVDFYYPFWNFFLRIFSYRINIFEYVTGDNQVLNGKFNG